MDRIVAGWRAEAEADGDLMLCPGRGVAWQADMRVTARYDADYFDRCYSYAGSAIASQINAGRVALVSQWFGDGPLLDVGIGSGEFIRRRGGRTFGYDVNPVAASWLRGQGVFRPDIHSFSAFTFWDVLEHVPEPESYFRGMARGAWLFACLPVFSDLRRIRESRHYRPGEHLYYWTAAGFVGWMGTHGFRHHDTAWYETTAGRDSILSFAFRRGM